MYLLSADLALSYNQHISEWLQMIYIYRSLCAHTVKNECYPNMSFGVVKAVIECYRSTVSQHVDDIQDDTIVFITPHPYSLKQCKL